MITLVLALALALALAQPQPQVSPLGGSRVVSGQRTGIVQTEMSGRVLRPEKVIEQVAVERLKLSDEVRARVEKVLLERAAGIDRFVTDNLLLLNQAQTVGAAGTLKEKVTLFFVGLDRIRGAVGGPRLQDRIEAVLPPEDAREFRATLREYWKALIAEAAAAKPQDPPPPWTVYLGESLASLGREIARSFQRQEASGTLVVDYLMADLALSEKQLEVVREMKFDLLERSGMKPSAEEQKKLVLGVVAYLNEKQRDKLIARFVKPGAR